MELDRSEGKYSECLKGVPRIGATPPLMEMRTISATTWRQLITMMNQGVNEGSDSTLCRTRVLCRCSFVFFFLFLRRRSSTGSELEPSRSRLMEPRRPTSSTVGLAFDSAAIQYTHYTHTSSVEWRNVPSTLPKNSKAPWWCLLCLRLRSACMYTHIH